MSDAPAIVQGDGSVLLEVDHPAYETARASLARFASLVKSPEHVHTYRIDSLALWNAASTGLHAEEVVATLRRISRFDVPSHLEAEIRSQIARYGVCSLHDYSVDDSVLRLAVREPIVREQLSSNHRVAAKLRPCPDGFLLAKSDRGEVKRAIMKLGWPTKDEAGLTPGAPLRASLRLDRFQPYPFQTQAVDAFRASGNHGVVVLPCGAGKTIVGLAAIADVGAETLIITSGRQSAEQWRRELLDKTTLSNEQVVVYRSRAPTLGPITIATYTMVAQKGGTGPTGHRHFDRLTNGQWGLLIFDEVHLLPARMFRLAAELQSRRRLGLTATLVREDGRAGDVFALIGPKRYDVPWRELESSGHIAEATCIEARIPLPDDLVTAYSVASMREQPRVAGENPDKLRVLAEIFERHGGDRILVIGTYLELLRAASKLLRIPIITGATSHRDREKLYAQFRSGECRALVLSKVGNFAIDLPEANVLIQLNGSMGSRQEEAQRLGRILRPKPGGATFYTLISRDTIEQKHALHRQLFLTEQGYRYYIDDRQPRTNRVH
ncbi:MAG: DNA repair helicase XPB [Myxococcota bacterium]